MPMESAVTFRDKLAEALTRKREDLERTRLVDVKSHFSAMHNGFKSIFNILLRKSLIQEDHYRFDKKISGIDVPSSDAFPDNASRSLERSNRPVIQQQTVKTQITRART